MQFQNRNNDKNQDNKNDPEQQNPQPDWQRWIWPAVLIILTGWIVIQFFDNANSNPNIENITYDVLVEQAGLGNISEITIREQNASGKFINSVDANSIDSISEFSTYLPEDYNNLLDTLESTQLIGSGDIFDTAVIDIQPPQDASIFIYILQFAPLILIIGFLVWMARRTQRQMNGAFGFGRTQAREYNVERPQITFEDVAGQEAAKKELVEIVDFLKEPDKYIALGARIPRGVLLIGPPGTGKTLLARAVAGEANVSFFSIAASEFVEMFVGVGASRVRDLFKRAKENSPSIVFIDEIDAVGRQRGAGLGGGHDEREQTLNQLLAEMDGFDRTESVIVMAATNRNDVLDPALLRPGRFDRQVTVGMPGRKGRFAILKIHTRGKPLGVDVKLDNLARGTIGFSGADLANLANEAALNAARRNAKKISMRDFSNAFDRIVLGTESPPLSDPHERRVIAYHEAGHALVATLTPEADPVLKVTIVPRGQALGVMAQMPNDDRRNHSAGYILAQMYVALGGRASEELVIGEITTGAAHDLRRVTDLANRMVSQFGMSKAIGPLNYGDNERQPFLGQSLSQGRNYSEQTASQIDAEVRKIVEGAYEHTINLLSENRDKLEALAEALLTHEIIEQDEMLRILGMSVEETDSESGSLSDSSKSAGHFSLGSEPNEEQPSPSPKNGNGNGSSPNGTSSTDEKDDKSDRESDPDYNPFIE